jgi:hypothetical protein
MNPDPRQQPADEAPAPSGTGVPGSPGHQPAPVDLSTESVAGEEDPGASIDLADPPGTLAPDAPIEP